MGHLCAKDFCCMVYKDCNNVRKVSITPINCMVSMVFLSVAC